MNLKYKKLGEVCEILDSRRIPITASARKAGQYPYYGANGIQDYVADFIFDDELVLLAEDGGNFGSSDRPIAYRVSGKCWVNNHAHVLKPLPGIDVDYLCYALMFYDTSGLVNGATRQKLTQAAMRQMEIPIRSWDEQKIIVKKIKSAAGLIALRKSQVQKLDQLASSRFIEMFVTSDEKEFSWNIQPLQLLADVVSGITKGRKTKCQNLISVPYMAVSNVNYGYINWSNLKTIDATQEEIKQYQLFPGDVLMTEGGDPDKVGRGAILNSVPQNCIHQNHIFRVRLHQNMVEPVFFAGYLQQKSVKQYFLKCAKQTTGIASINMTQLRSLPVILPPLELQNEFAAFIAQLDKSKVICNKMHKEVDFLQFWV